MRTSWESFVLNNLKTSVYTAIEISLQKRKNIHFPGQAAGGERSGEAIMAEKKAVRAVIKGRVQGVCYRMETAREAEKHNVSGWVMNRSDGTVEALFEGEKPKVEAMLDWCRQGPPAASVKDVETEEIPYTGQFKDFSVRYTS
jgi:acylphosphatase